MNSQITLDRPHLELTIENSLDMASKPTEDLASYHDCLVASYLSYLKAAGYSQLPQEIRRFERGARGFLSKFPDSQLWLKLSIEDLLRCHCTERGFVNYLFLRRLLPMPLEYLLMPRPHLFQMAIRLMERETYQLYEKASSRLGYREPIIKDQFRALLSLMIWAQKPLQSLTLDDLNIFTEELRMAYAGLAIRNRKVLHGLPYRWDVRLSNIQNVLYHMGVFPQLTRSTRRTGFEKQWAPLQHKSNGPGDVLCPATRYHLLAALYYFFIRISEWQWPEAPTRVLVFPGDFPILDAPSPKFLDEIAAAKFLQVARAHPDLFTRLCCITLILTGMRQGEFLDLTADCIVQIGENYWLRVPLGKMHNDRYIPLHPEVKQLLDEWIDQSPPKKPYDFLFASHGHRLGRGKVALAVERIRKAAGIKEHISPHRLRHTLATLAINRGMPLESIAALLGHRSLSMTMVYARIGNRTVQQEYSQVSEHLEELCNRVDLVNRQPSLVEGDQMRRLRQDHWRMLGNGYCTRPDGVPCEYETICESCPCFSTTVEFLPVLQKQKQDAEEKRQIQRVDVFAKLIKSME